MDSLKAYIETGRRYVAGNSRGKKNSPMSAVYRIQSGERGIALVMVLILAAISLAIMAALVYMITATTQVSGFQKRYNTALEAGKGGAGVMFQTISAAGDPGYIQTTLGGSIPAQLKNVTVNGSATNCLAAKLNNVTSDWNGAGKCNSDLNIDPGTSDTYDLKFQLGTAQAYDVYAKIVDTVPGNSSRYASGATGLIKSGVISANSGEVPVMSMPYLYTIEVKAVNAGNTAEKADYSILYEY